MNIAAIFDLVSKGISAIEMAVQVGQEVAPAINVVKNIITGAQEGTVTDDQLAQAEAELDQMITEFNSDVE